MPHVHHPYHVHIDARCTVPIKHEQKHSHTQREKERERETKAHSKQTNICLMISYRIYSSAFALLFGSSAFLYDCIRLRRWWRWWWWYVRCVCVFGRFNGIYTTAYLSDSRNTLCAKWFGVDRRMHQMWKYKLHPPYLFLRTHSAWTMGKYVKARKTK